MKVSRNPKTKPDAQTDVPLQVISENSTEEYTVTAADDYSSGSSLEKKKRS
jgi:hypothetical protein